MRRTCKICDKVKEMFSWENTCYSCQKEQNLKRIQERIVSGEKDVDTYSSDYVICPYCGYAHETCYGYEDFSELYEEGDHEIECCECGKTFVMETNISYSYETRRTDND